MDEWAYLIEFKTKIYKRVYELQIEKKMKENQKNGLDMCKDDVLANQKERQKVEALLERLKKTARKTKENLKDRSGKDMRNLDLQIEMVENQNELRRKIHVDNHWS